MAALEDFSFRKEKKCNVDCNGQKYYVLKLLGMFIAQEISFDIFYAINIANNFETK